MKKLDIGSAELGALANMMRRVEFFSPLTVGQLERVLPQVMLGSYAAGEKVFAKGEPGDAFYIVYKGSVDVRLPQMLVFSKSVARLKMGSFFGEIALISREPRTATVVCVEDSLLFSLLATDFEFVLRENPATAEQMRSIAAQRRFATDHS